MATIYNHNRRGKFVEMEYPIYMKEGQGTNPTKRTNKIIQARHEENDI
jgi:hypothetical protein